MSEATASPALYRAPRSERRRIGKALRELREFNQDLDARAESEQRKTWKPWMRHVPVLNAQGRPDEHNLKARELANLRIRPPIKLLACGVCKRPTTQCECRDADGNPLDWGAMA